MLDGVTCPILRINYALYPALNNFFIIIIVWDIECEKDEAAAYVVSTIGRQSLG